MQYLLPLLLLGISGALFFTWIDPQYTEIEELQTAQARYDDILAKTAEVREFREKIQSKYNTIQSTDFERLESLLPSHIDNIQLILDINSIAKKKGLNIKDIRIDRKDGARSGGRETIETSSEGVYETVGFSFSVVSTYDNFKSFLNDMAKSLRLVDVMSVTVTEIGDEQDFYRFDVGIRTYWLK